METDNIVRSVLAGPVDSPPTVLAQTDWLDHPPPSELRRLYREYGAHFELTVAAAIRIVGEPTSLLLSDDTDGPPGYEEAIRFASWPRGEDTFYVALVHHDRETPIMVEAGLVSSGAIADRSS